MNIVSKIAFWEASFRHLELMKSDNKQKGEHMIFVHSRFALLIHFIKFLFTYKDLIYNYFTFKNVGVN